MTKFRSPAADFLILRGENQKTSRGKKGENQLIFLTRRFFSVEKREKIKEIFRAILKFHMHKFLHIYAFSIFRAFFPEFCPKKNSAEFGVFRKNFTDFFKFSLPLKKTHCVLPENTVYFV